MPMESLAENGTIDIRERRPLADVVSSYSGFNNGDVIYAKVTPCFENGKAAPVQGLSTGVAFGTTEVTVLRPRKTLHQRFLYYLISEDRFRGGAIAAMTGAGGLRRVPDSYARDFSFSMPPLVEQQRIAEFLDRETAQIDELIAKHEQLISTLAERQQSATVRAVTTGLDPGRERRSTNLAWAPEVPVDWTIEPVRNFASFRTGWTPPSGQEHFYGGAHSWANISDLAEPVVYETAKTLSDEGAALGMMEPAEVGDLLFSFKLSVGRVSRAGARMYTNEAIAAFRPGPRIDLDFAYYAFPIALLENASRNIYGAPLLNAQLIRGARVPLPPLHEQARIAAHLHELTGAIGAATSTAEELVRTLRERRQALISAAVTGQIDVGGAS